MGPWEIIYHSAELSTIAVIAWRAIRALNRHDSMTRDFPPHRHIRGMISYPKGFEPPKMERMGD